ncbi:MAG TPA: HD domain-containing phosphohydrolase [Longimicrobium sp.]|jgi:putative nucleotidyltransferase with HDIG domain|nr:HD domain-containing phosphohydrolase [Longimicrobium sp.]
MSDAALFLTAFAQAVATMVLYEDGHPARGRALDAAYRPLADLQARSPRQTFTFLDGEVVHGSEVVRELGGWEWSARLVAAGVQRLEFDEAATLEELEELLDDVLARLTVSAVGNSPETRQLRRTRIRIGAVGVRGETEAPDTPVASLDYSLAEEVDAVRWMHEEVQMRRDLPLAEAEAVVRALAVAMHGDQRLILPLLRLRDHDQYTTTHSMNVSVMSMAMAEFMGYAPSDVRAFGVAGLLHDLGKVFIPADILNKPGKLTPQEREVINRHPTDGARLLLDSGERLEMAAVVAYEHHRMHDGGGYPSLHYCRGCHSASRIAHVCDVYDALRTHRPYRAAWTSAAVVEYIGERAGSEFDPDVARAFVRMMQQWEPRFAELDDVRASVRLSASEGDPALAEAPEPADPPAEPPSQRSQQFTVDSVDPV